MLFKISIENFGKITKADIRIGDFTVFAGKNGTGKSYVSKAMYSLFGAMHANHLAVVLNPHLLLISRALSPLEEAFGEEEIEEMDALVDMRHAVDNLYNITRQVYERDDVDEFDAIKEALPDIHKFLDRVAIIFPRLENEMASAEDHPNMMFLGISTKRTIGNIKEAVSELTKIKSFEPEMFVKEGVRHEIEENFLRNFQIHQTSSLRGEMDMLARLDVDKIGAEVEIGEDIGWRVEKSGLRLMQKYSRVLYLESPIFWRLKDALDNAGVTSLHGRNPITGVPKYYYDMSFALRQSYPGNSICPDILERLTGDSVLGGRVAVGESGNLFFQSNKGKKYPLHMAATGIANLGMLALLIEKNLLDENTFLFIDEPEAHLHPAWQVEMAEALFALSREGVKVVIATHSAEILKWLEVEVNTPELQEMVALNHFIHGAVQTNGVQFDEKLSTMQKDLAEPYYKLYYKGL